MNTNELEIELENSWNEYKKGEFIDGNDLLHQYLETNSFVVDIAETKKVRKKPTCK